MSQLRIVGRIDLPAPSSTFAAMNRAVDNTTAGEAAAFQAPGGATAPSHAAWASLRDDLQNVLGTTATSILDAGITIEHVVDAYLATDEAARTSLEAAWANGQTPNLQEAEEKFTQSAPPAVVIKGDGT